MRRCAPENGLAASRLAKLDRAARGGEGMGNGRAARRRYRSGRSQLPDALLTVVSVQWFGSEAIERTYKRAAGAVANELLFRHDEARREKYRRARPPLELRRRRCDVPPRVRGAAHPAGASLRSRAGGWRSTRPISNCCRTRSPPSTKGADRPRGPGTRPRSLSRKPRRAVAGRAGPPVSPAVGLLRDPDPQRAGSGAQRELVSGDAARGWTSRSGSG